MKQRPENRGPRSVARETRASKQVVFPGVKMDLGIVVLVLLCLWFVVSIAGLSHLQGLAVLGAGSSLAALWLAFRIRRALLRAEARIRRGELDHGP